MDLTTIKQEEFDDDEKPIKVEAEDQRSLSVAKKPRLRKVETSGREGVPSSEQQFYTPIHWIKQLQEVESRFMNKSGRIQHNIASYKLSCDIAHYLYYENDITDKNYSRKWISEHSKQLFDKKLSKVQLCRYNIYWMMFNNDEASEDLQWFVPVFSMTFTSQHGRFREFVQDELLHFHVIQQQIETMKQHYGSLEEYKKIFDF